MDIAAWMREWRVEEKGWSQRQLAEEMNYWGLASWTKGTVATIEAGHRGLAAFELVGLLDVFDVSYERFRLEISVPVGNTTNVGFPSARRVLLDVTDQKAARSLALEVHELQQLAQALWGRRLAEERDARALMRPGWELLDKATQRAIKGHITRELLEVLVEEGGLDG